VICVILAAMQLEEHLEDPDKLVVRYDDRADRPLWIHAMTRKERCKVWYGGLFNEEHFDSVLDGASVLKERVLVVSYKRARLEQAAVKLRKAYDRLHNSDEILEQAAAQNIGSLVLQLDGILGTKLAPFSATEQLAEQIDAPTGEIPIVPAPGS
jgi:hypothetical protein